MDRLTKLLKIISIIITIMIILNGIALLVIYGFKILFFILMMIELCFLILQVIYIKKANYNKLINLVYIFPFPLVYLITVIGGL